MYNRLMYQNRNKIQSKKVTEIQQQNNGFQLRRKKRHIRWFHPIVHDKEHPIHDYQVTKQDNPFDQKPPSMMSLHRNNIISNCCKKESDFDYTLFINEFYLLELTRIVPSSFSALKYNSPAKLSFFTTRYDKPLLIYLKFIYERTHYIPDF